MSEFSNGQKIDTIHFNDAEFISASEDIEIEIVMECGQMSLVPWAKVKNKTKKTIHGNL